MTFRKSKGLFIGLIALTGCATTHYTPKVIAPVSIGPKEQFVAMASGKGESLMDAIRNAIGRSGADTITNVFVDEEENCYDGMFGTTCLPTGNIRIFGTLIKYDRTTESAQASTTPQYHPDFQETPTDKGRCPHK